MKTRVLLAHNYYKSSLPSGETQVVEAERELLRQRGHEVRGHFRFSDQLVEEGVLGNFKGALSVPWNPFSARRMKQEVESFKPEVVHVHNTFPLLSPAIFHSIGGRAARVLTLHNYRPFCSAAVLMRKGIVCTECITRSSSWPAFKYGCYRNSRLATIPLAAGVKLHRLVGTWVDKVDAFIVFTEFQRDLVIDAGLPKDLVHIKPNFFPGIPNVALWAERAPRVVFVGRLSEEKGVDTLLRAWMEWGKSAPELRIIGEGELRDRLESKVKLRTEIPIRFLGTLSRSDTMDEIARSSLLVLPSECIEGFPLAVREAFAFGTPVAVSNLGSLPSIVKNGKNGVLFTPADPRSLLSIVRKLWNEEGELERLGRGARQSFKQHYTEDRNYEVLMDIYRQATEVNERRRFE